MSSRPAATMLEIVMRYAWILLGAMAVAGCQTSNTQYGLTGDQDEREYTNPRTYNSDDNPSWDPSIDKASPELSPPTDLPDK